MATALELKLKPGEEIFVARGIYTKIDRGDFLALSDFRNHVYFESRGRTFKGAPKARVLSVNGSEIMIEYLEPYESEFETIQEGQRQKINNKFDGFSRKRNIFQRALDTFSYFFKRYFL
ncbi:hypothetical protein DRN73_06665 [Candidatus Pacearchaeota archaeon]|nr:MAG: hypothetical protein DRN73_06665 [Candidatus Pacearchaeota archaeon]